MVSLDDVADLLGELSVCGGGAALERCSGVEPKGNCVC